MKPAWDQLDIGVQANTEWMAELTGSSNHSVREVLHRYSLRSPFGVSSTLSAGKRRSGRAHHARADQSLAPVVVVAKAGQDLPGVLAQTRRRAPDLAG